MSHHAKPFISSWSCALIAIALLSGQFTSEAQAQFSTTEKLQDLQSRYDTVVGNFISQVQGLTDDPDLFNSLASKAEAVQSGELMRISNELSEAKKLIAEREAEINRSGLAVEDRNELKAALSAQKKPLEDLLVKADGFKKTLVDFTSSKLKSWREVYDSFLSVSGPDKARTKLRSLVNEYCKPYALPPPKASAAAKPAAVAVSYQPPFAQSPLPAGPAPPPIQQAATSGQQQPFSTGLMDTIALKAHDWFGTSSSPPRQPPPGSKVLPFPDALRRANQGDAYAQAVVSIYYGTGYLTGRDPVKAADYAIRSAKQRHPLGLYRLGAMLQSGDGMPVSREEGARLKQAAFDGLNNMSGDPYAITALAVMVFRGEGVQKNRSEAARLYKIAADSGYAPAQYNLSACLLAGHGVRKDQTQAEAYWRKACDQGYELALQGMPR